MPSELQERILRKLIENLPSSLRRSVDVTNLSELPLVFSAIAELDRNGYLVNTCTFSSAEAILTEKGSNYFEDKSRQKYGDGITEKIALIDESIVEACKVLNRGEVNEMNSFVSKVDKNYIEEKITEGLDIYPRQTHIKTTYSMSGDNNHLHYDGKIINQKNNIEIIIGRLKKHRATCLIETDTTMGNSKTIHIENNPIFNNTINVQITINSVFDLIEKSVGLIQDDKDVLREKLSEIERLSKSKKPVWEKIKGLLGWIANKSVDVALATTLVPYLAEIVRGCVG